MRYDQLAQNALRGVVREALRKVEKTGLPGEHHFYIAFNTRYPGVNIGERLAQRYPREMTIVLQHQFSGLRVSEDHFDVELSFDNVPERLSIPFAAIKGFLDPAVQFGLQFEVVPADIKMPVEAHKEDEAKPLPARGRSRKVDPEGDSPPAAGEAAKVVSLDAFRKK